MNNREYKEQKEVDKAITKLKILQKGIDDEVMHCEADYILCELLNCLGYSEVVEEYNKVDKFYG